LWILQQLSGIHLEKAVALGGAIELDRVTKRAGFLESSSFEPKTQ